MHLDRRYAVQPRQRALLLGAVFSPADVADENRRAVHRRNDKIVEIPGIGDASHGAQHFFPRPAGDVPAGDIGVLPLDCVAHGGDRNLIGREAVRIHPYVDRPLQAADQTNLSHARRSLKLHLHDLVGDFGQLPESAIAGYGDGEDRLVFVVEFGNDRGVDVPRQTIESGGNPVAHVLGGGVDIAVEVEGGDDK